MKSKLILAVVAASALLLSSCRKADEVTPSESQFDELEFTATIDGPVTKTTVNTNKDSQDRGKIEWEKGDSILIKDAKGNEVYYVTEEGDGTFRKKAGQSARLAYGSTYSATYGTAPADTQKYEYHYLKDTLARNVYMTTGTPVASRSLTFKAACGLLKLTLMAKDEADEYITKVGVLNIDEKKDTVSRYWLTCGADGVSIKNGNDFYLTLPKGEYNRMVFYNKEDKSCEKQCKDGNGMEIKDNIIQPVTIDDITFASARSVLLPGEFSVSAGKKVQFTSGNLWWGVKSSDTEAAWHLEESQTAYPASWNTNHVGLFFWTNLADYNSGNAAYMPYAATYSYSAQSKIDTFFCGVDNPMTVDGQSGLYALTKDEWVYLLGTSTERSGKYKNAVTVNGVKNCLVIAPDNYSGTLLSEYSEDTTPKWSEAEESGLVCLPAAGLRNGSSMHDGGSCGLYWSATPVGSYESRACDLIFNDCYVDPSDDIRSYGGSVRLVKKVPEFYPGTEMEGIKIDGVIWAPVNCGYDADHTYGLLYQWGRKYGQAYEVETIEPVDLTKEQGGNSDNSSKFGKYNTSTYNWFTGTVDNTLWTEGSKGTYDPCPSGWRVPTEAELIALISKKAWGKNTVGGVEQTGYWFNGSSAASGGTGVFLPAAGCRYFSNGKASGTRGVYGDYWSSSVNGDSARSLNFYNVSAPMDIRQRANGYSVRCVQE